MNKKQKSGFTLVEIIVVISIIALLAAVGIGTYSTHARNARDSRRRVDLDTIRSALELYKSNNDFYPNSTNLLAPNYLETVPQDPRGGAYPYTPTGCSGINCRDYTLRATLEAGGTITLTPRTIQ